MMLLLFAIGLWCRTCAKYIIRKEFFQNPSTYHSLPQNLKKIERKEAHSFPKTKISPMLIWILMRNVHCSWTDLPLVVGKHFSKAENPDFFSHLLIDVLTTYSSGWSGVWILSDGHDTVLLSLERHCRWYICNCASDLLVRPYPELSPAALTKQLLPHSFCASYHRNAAGPSEDCWTRLHRVHSICLNLFFDREMEPLEQCPPSEV